MIRPKRFTRRNALRLGGLAAAAVAGSMACGSDREGSSSAPDSPEQAHALDSFDSSLPAGPETGLPSRVAWATTANTDFFRALGRGMEESAKARGVQYLSSFSSDDQTKNLRQLESFIARGVGALAFQPLNQEVQSPVLEAALAKGVCLQGIITYPSTLQIAASQYDIGFAQGKAAADYAIARLDRKAEVHYFNNDMVPQLKIRHTGLLDGLRTGGAGVRVVSDVRAIGETAGAAISGALQTYPDIKIVLGGDFDVVRAYRATEQAGRLSDDMYFSGIDGEPEALELIKGRTPYRSTLAFGWQLMGYGLGQFAADWIEGKQIPRVMVANSVLLDSPESVDGYLADNGSPAMVFADRSRYERYLPLLGNVSYATRETIWREEYIPK